MDNLYLLSDIDLKLELTAALKKRKRIVSEIDKLDTDIIGIKEEIRRRKEKQLEKL